MRRRPGRAAPTGWLRVRRRVGRRALAAAGWATALGAAACGTETPPREGPPLSLADVLAGADTAGYARATEPRPFDFPADHGPHPSFRSEWWYVTGNLTAEDGRAFGFQLTIFRSALAPEAPDAASAWATSQAYLAHFTVTDVAAGRFHAHERFARGAMGLAGARAEPFRVWLGRWRLEAPPPTAARTSPTEPARAAAGETFPIVLAADTDSVALELRLERGKPPVPQGEGGLSRKGPEPGNASHYYSLTRMPAAGTLVLDADTMRVEGLAWLDREWSTSALSPGVAGWDWFALQLDDGWELMVYRLRRADGGATRFSQGMLVDPTGRGEPLSWGRDVTVEELGTWTSPIDDTPYPSAWVVRLPRRGWALEVRPAVPDQELALSFRYWEGAVVVDGAGEGGRPVEGRGYVELTGYAESARAGDDRAVAPPR